MRRRPAALARGIWSWNIALSRVSKFQEGVACRMQERYVNRRAYVSYSYVCLYMHEILLPPPFVHTHLITHTQCSAVIARTPTSHIFTRIRLFLYNMYINTHILVLNTCAQTPTLLLYIFFRVSSTTRIHTDTHARVIQSPAVGKPDEDSVLAGWNYTELHLPHTHPHTYIIVRVYIYTCECGAAIETKGGGATAVWRRRRGSSSGI